MLILKNANNEKMQEEEELILETSWIVTNLIVEPTVLPLFFQYEGC